MTRQCYALLLLGINLYSYIPFTPLVLAKDWSHTIILCWLVLEIDEVKQEEAADFQYRDNIFTMAVCRTITKCIDQPRFWSSVGSEQWPNLHFRNCRSW